MKENTKIEQLSSDTDIITVDNQTYPSSYPFHWHQFVECIAITKSDSTAIVSINQKHVTMESNDILFIWPGELHEVIDNSSKSIIALQFPLSLINSKKEFAACHELYRENQLFSYKENPKLNDSLLSEIQKIISVSKNISDPFMNIRMTLCLYELFIQIATYKKETDTHARIKINESDHIIDKINIACSYITNHCTENLTLEEVASYVGFSACYFSRHFKKITTHNFVEYLNIQRINKFQVLLTDKSISITDAAFRSGFKSISTVNRVFAKYCGCSPSDFRKLHVS